LDIELLRDVRELHDISGGKPYEIQLICHMLFRRVQSERSEKMKLNLGVLEEVRKELESFQNIATRPIITKVRNMKRKRLAALSLFCRGVNTAIFENVWALEYIFNPNTEWTEFSLREELEYFINEDILFEDSDILKFNGDEFDKIYIKYFARE
jgi:hypothetical protein